MPIYAYRCTNCGHARDVLQKLSDPVLTVCPACGEPSFAKQVTAAGFQLKGSGWYVTDFRSDAKAQKKAGDGDAAADKGASGDEAKPAAATAPSGDAAATPAGEKTAKPAEAAKTASAPAPAPAPAKPAD